MLVNNVNLLGVLKNEESKISRRVTADRLEGPGLRGFLRNVPPDL
jgi:hypothetical protein